MTVLDQIADCQRCLNQTTLTGRDTHSAWEHLKRASAALNELNERQHGMPIPKQG